MRTLLRLAHLLLWVIKFFSKIAAFIYAIVGFIVVLLVVIGVVSFWQITSDIEDSNDLLESLSLLSWEQEWADASALEDYADEFVLNIDMDNWLAESQNDYAGKPLKLLLAETVEHVAEDQRIKAVVFRFNQYTPELSDVQYLSRVFSQLTEKDKKVYAHVGSFLSLASYAFLQSADEVWISPLSTLWLAGYGYENFYYADLLEALGTSAVVVKRKGYKSAADSTLYSKASEFEKEQVQALLDDRYNQSRQITLDGERITSAGEFDAMVDTGIYTPFQALNDGLVDDIGYYRDMLHALEDELGLKEEDENDKNEENEENEENRVEYVDLFSYMASVGNALENENTGNEKLIAYINLEGPIYSSANNGTSFFSDNMGINAHDWEPIIRDLVEDKETKGAILRISSGGGEAFASDVLWGAIRALNDEKPVVVVVDSIAASGGYYMASAGEKIVMERGATTGSIGVVLAYLEHSRLLEKMGIHAEQFKKGRFSAGFISPARRPNEAELEKLNESIDHVYDGFIARVSEGRELSREEVEAFAQGRVWSGEKALDLGLADIEGGLPEAVEEMKQLLKLEDGEKLLVQTYAQDRDFGSIFESFRYLNVYAQKVSQLVVGIMHALGQGVNGNNGQVMMRADYAG